jgi:hypothetical protein
MNQRSSSRARRAAHRRSILLSVVRALSAVTFLLIIYYQAPLDPTQPTGILFLLGLAGLAAMVVLQVRAILNSPFPRLRAIESVAVWVPALLVLYAASYSVIAITVPGSFSQSLDRTDALYFTMTVFATVGFGDIVPVTQLARIITMTQMVAGLITVGVVAKVLLGAVEVAVKERDSRSAPDADTTVSGSQPG